VKHPWETIIACLAALFGFLFGSDPKAIGILYGLLGLMVFDIMTGCLNGWTHENFSSREFRKGLIKKAGTLILISACQLIEAYKLMPIDGIQLQLAASSAFAVVELASLAENLADIGIPIPSFILKAIGREGPKESEAVNGK
jgi:toxin secretion/phage lysis holin